MMEVASVLPWLLPFLPGRWESVEHSKFYLIFLSLTLGILMSYMGKIIPVVFAVSYYSWSLTKGVFSVCVINHVCFNKLETS